MKPIEELLTILTLLFFARMMLLGYTKGVIALTMALLQTMEKTFVKVLANYN